MGKEIVNQVQEAEGSKQEKKKKNEEHTKI